MQRLRASWFIRRPSIALQPSYQKPRYASRASWPRNGVSEHLTAPTFNINSLLLDLDAEDAKHVRTYDPEIDGEPEEQSAKRDRERDAIAKRISDFKQVAREYEKNFESLLNDRAYEWHINNLDVLSTVLIGPAHETVDPTREHPTTTRGLPDIDADLAELGKGISQQTRQPITRRNGIPPSVMRDAPKSIAYLLHQQRRAHDRTTRDSTEVDWEISVSKLLQNQESFVKLKRMVQYLLDTPNGSLLVSKLSGELGGKCSSFHTAHEFQETTAAHNTSALDLLGFCNDVVHNLSDKCLPVGNQLWTLGFHVALRCSAFSAARMHLAAGLNSERQDSSTLHEVKAFLCSLLDWLDGTEGHRNLWSSSVLPSQERLAAIFSLLTGYDPGRNSSNASIHSIMEWIAATDYMVFSTYVQILGEIGALRTLWYTYQLLSKVSTKMGGSSHPGHCNNPGSEDPGGRLFIHAFLRHLQNTVHGYASLRVSRHHKIASGVFVEDIQWDSQTIKAFRASRQAPPTNQRRVDKRVFRVRLRTASHEKNQNSEVQPPGVNRHEQQDILELGSIYGEEIITAFGIPNIQHSLTALYGILERASSPGQPRGAPYAKPEQNGGKPDVFVQ